MHDSGPLREADRLMTICNACRYCEGLCAVFPAMEMRRSFLDSDLTYLANLCHQCGACYAGCQYAPPHEFAVNVPLALAQLRKETYQTHVWPAAVAAVFDRNGLAVALVTALCVAAFLIGFAAWTDPAALFGRNSGPGAFFAVMPHTAMVALFGGVSLYVIAASALSLRAYWRKINADAPAAGAAAIWQAIVDTGSLRYLDGGGGGCAPDPGEPTGHRRLFHHLTFYGFLLCFAATTTATFFHYALGWIGPYPATSPPVILGSLGGVGLLIGPAGLVLARRRNAAIADPAQSGMNLAFIVMLFLTSLTGFLLLLFRGTAAMGTLLAIHLGIVLGLFVSLPYGKFVHGLYRVLSLAKYAAERRDPPGKA
jgi:citrate/tricarballylate utilization protein